MGRDYPQNFAQDTMGGMGNQGMMFGSTSSGGGNQTTTQVSIPKDVRQDCKFLQARASHPCIVMVVV